MGLFANIKNVKVTAGGVYFEPGSYKVRVNKVSQGKTREGRPFFVAEFTILESNNTARPVGSSVSWMVMLDKNVDTGLANIKMFASALFGISPDDVDEAGIEALVSAENPAQGKEVMAAAAMIKTKAQKDFTRVLFTPAE